MSKITDPATVDSAADSGLADRTSGTVLPGYVLDAMDLPALIVWRPDTPGDYVAGALVRWGTREIRRLDGDGTRKIPVALIHGVTVRLTEDGEYVHSDPAYIELAGYSTVLERHLAQLATADPGTIMFVQYLGKFASPTKGHSDYQDFDVRLSSAKDHTGQVPLDVITNAPDVNDRDASVLELDPGEPF